MLIIIAICNRILYKEYSKWTLYLEGIVGYFMKLWAVFINQSNQFENICCVKHLILNSVTVISIFVMTLLFNSQILSKLLFHPLVIIDTLDDLVEFITHHQDVELISDNKTYTWSIMKNLDDERAQFIFRKMASVPITKFDYKQVYHGKSIIISFDNRFELILTANKHLNFHMSSDRLFGNQYGFIYSKNIDINAKQIIDSISNTLFESGIHNQQEQRLLAKPLKFIRR